MSDGTKIEWSDATTNFLNGCTVVSPGCTNCYAMRLAGTRMQHHPTRVGLTQPTKAGPVWTGEIRPHWPALAQVLSWTRPRMIFWNAHGDLFHENVPDELIDAIIAAVALTPQHRHQLLTKRSARMRAYFEGWIETAAQGAVARFASAMTLIWRETKHPRCRPGASVPFVPHPLPNLWMGVSAEDQARWDERVADLRGVNALVRWVSAEPLLGSINDDRDMVGIDWVVAGGESGPGARPMHPVWERELRHQCEEAGVPYLGKQWGAWGLERKPGAESIMFRPDGSLYVPSEPDGYTEPAMATMWRVGKKAAGRLFDGQTHDGYPA